MSRRICGYITFIPQKMNFQATEAYLSVKHADFFDGLSEQRWISQYEGEIKHEVILEQF